jgi:hypothetical protein
MAKAPKSIHCPECGGTAIFETRTDAVEYQGHTAAVKVPVHRRAAANLRHGRAGLGRFATHGTW